MQIFFSFLKGLHENKEAQKIIILICLGLCLLIIGRLSVSEPIVSEFCVKQIRTIDDYKVKNDILTDTVVNLENEIKKIQQERYDRETQIIDRESKHCNVRIAEKIKKIKKLYIDAKCKICKKH